MRASYSARSRAPTTSTNTTVETYSLLREMVNLLKEIEVLESKVQEGQRQMGARWEEFGHFVRDAREDQRLSLVELAQRMGTTKSMLAYLEQGKRTWKINVGMNAVEALQHGRIREIPAQKIAAETQPQASSEGGI
jgi:ribosome-binding protein aMBF1 (putative translation factor)